MERPLIVCLCGSTRFGAAYEEATLQQTLLGKIVLSVGCTKHHDDDLFPGRSPAEQRSVKADLDVLHLAKIDLADEVLILNVDGYVGESTEREIAYAKMRGKTLLWLEAVHPVQQAKKER